jgi:hypothetical protein
MAALSSHPPPTACSVLKTAIAAAAIRAIDAAPNAASRLEFACGAIREKGAVAIVDLRFEHCIEAL